MKTELKASDIKGIPPHILEAFQVLDANGMLTIQTTVDILRAAGMRDGVRTPLEASVASDFLCRPESPLRAACKATQKVLHDNRPDVVQRTYEELESWAVMCRTKGTLPNLWSNKEES